MYDFHPGLILIAFGAVCLLLPDKIRRWVALLAPVVALGALFSLNSKSELSYAFSGSFVMDLLHVDRLSWSFCLFFCIIAVIAGIYGLNGAKRGEKGASLIYAGASICVVLAGDWITLICFWEVMAAASTYMVWCGRTHNAHRAAFRYLVMHFFGGNMLLAGVITIISTHGNNVTLLTDPGEYAYWFVLIGVAVNAAIPPLHTWVPDAYPVASHGSTVYLGSYTTKVAIYALIRIFAGTEVLVIVGAVMAVFAACMALLEDDLKKLLSYHIVSQLGMMVAALATGTEAGIDGAALHAGFNILYKGVLLMGAGAVITATGKTKISEMGGIGGKMPFTASCFMIASLAIAGMPLLNGFASKALIMEGLSEGGFTVSYWLVMLAGIGTWLSITLKINYFAFWRKTDKKLTCKPIPMYMNIAMGVGTLLCIVTGLIPSLGYSLMPEQTMAHPFTAEHILEYLGMFIGATIPFVLFIRKMKPHPTITLDFDWFYRRPLASLIFGISKCVYMIFDFGEEVAMALYLRMKMLLNNPGKVLKNVKELREDDEEGEVEDEKPVGQFMQIFLMVMVVLFLIIIIAEQENIL